MRVHCERCDSMVPADNVVHSCFDAALLKTCIEVATQHREAERAVIEAAVALRDAAHESPAWYAAFNRLDDAVDNLRKLEGAP